MRSLYAHTPKTLLALVLASSLLQAAEPSPAANPQSSSTDLASASASTEGKLSRWLNMDELSFSTRYRTSESTDGQHIFNNGQQRSLLKGKFKLDAAGHYFVGFRISSGTYFNWSYANFQGLDFGAALNNNINHFPAQHLGAVFGAIAFDPQASTINSKLVANGWALRLRDLYLSASPISPLTFEYGGIPIERGAGSEITTYDEDGYMQGGRVRVKLPTILFADQVAATFAFVGDPTNPNLFTRGEHFKQHNYSQFLADKHLGKRLYASLDFTETIGTHTMREAIRVKVPEARVLDTARFELYQRTNGLQMPGFFAQSGSGWAGSAARKIHQHYNIEGGYADIDPDYGVYSTSSLLTAAGFSLNGDAYQIGRRFFGRVQVQPVSAFNLFAFYTHEAGAGRGPGYYDFNRQSLNAGLTIDFKAILSEKLHLF